MKHAFLSFLLLFTSWSYALNEDSLQKSARFAANDSLRLDARNKLIWPSLFSNSAKAEKLIKDAEKLARLPHLAYGRVTLYGIKAIHFDLAGQKDSSLYYFTRSYDEAKKHHFPEQENHALGNLGMYHWNQGNSQQALDYFFRAIKQSKHIQNPKFQDQSGNYNNIGLIYQELNLISKALKYHQLALAQRMETNNKRGISASFNNIGICYSLLEKWSEAHDYFQKGDSIALVINDLQLHYQNQHGLAKVLLNQGQIDLALVKFKEILNRPNTVPINNNDLVSVYSSIAHTFVLLNQPDSAMVYAQYALRFQDENLDVKVNYPELYQWMGQACFQKGQTELGRIYLDSFNLIVQQKFSDKSAKYLQELEVEYESEKRDRKIKEKQLEVQKRNAVIFFISTLFLLVTLVFILLYSQKMAKNKKLLLEKELESARQEMKTKEELFKQRLDISRDLHDHIGSQLTFISSLVDQLEQEAERQKPMQHTATQLRFFIKHVFQELRDTVWAMNQASITISNLHERILRLVEQANQSQNKTLVTLLLEHEGFQFQELDSKECIHILAVLKEAVNNAVKHAQASEIKVEINQENSQLYFRVVDNGLGMTERNPPEGFGLENMRRRAQAIGAELSIKSSTQGTQVQLSLKSKK